ncbi:hypothetical protein OUZ56_020117 [Daphnia magna]|uniref:Uncharacterized protein n=1 Tax=Daphnia magna TaxID=35525 RepID=A0ABQ9ZDK3_9CRUS|nr:hypothetical protein OUZ56_020117 [Daphnia magna]
MKWQPTRRIKVVIVRRLSYTFYTNCGRPATHFCDAAVDSILEPPMSISSLKTNSICVTVEPRRVYFSIEKQSVINQRPFKVRIWPEIPPAGVHQKGRNVCAIRTAYDVR